MANILFAADFAAKAHNGQRRKNRTQDPYINHPIEVAALISAEDFDLNIREDILIAALLHDTIEDTTTTYNDIKERFGERVANMVAECSDDKKLPKVQRKKLQIEHAANVSIGAALVKLADKLSNLSALKTDPPTEWTESIIRGYVVWSYAVVQALKISVGKHNAPVHILAALDRIFESFGVMEHDAEALQGYYDELGK